jgi:hypothetical protein
MLKMLPATVIKSTEKSSPMATPKALPKEVYLIFSITAISSPGQCGVKPFR